MKRLWLCVLLLWTVSASSTEESYEYDSEENDSDEYESDEEEYLYSSEVIDYVYTNNYTQCIEESNTISCNITLTNHNIAEYAAILSGPPPEDRKRRIVLKCIACDLEQFPNEVANTGFRWQVLNFASSHIKQLKMNALIAEAANTIHTLYLNNNSISQLDDDSFPTSHSIFELNLSRNRIENIFGISTFNKIKNLMTLNLAYNQIKYLEPFVFKHLIHLQQLELNDNRLLDPSFTGHLNGFHMTLTLSNNPIVRLEGNIRVDTLIMRNSSITNCSFDEHVETLVITDGILRVIDLSYATNVKLVNLSSNHLIDFEFMNPTHLKELDLCNNRLQTVRLGITRLYSKLNLARNNITSTVNLSLPHTLKDLNLSHNPIHNLAPETFKNLTRLWNLHMAQCGLRTLNADIFKTVKNLRHLDLSDNRLVQMDLNIFQGLHLAEVKLNGNRLTDLNVEDINVDDTKYPTKLGISNNHWKCKRLEVIVDNLKQRNAIALHEQDDLLRYKENVNGIACHSDEYVASTEVSNENEADERFTEAENPISKKLYEITTIRHPIVDNHNVTSIVHDKIMNDLDNILKDNNIQRVLKNPERNPEQHSDTKNMENYNHTITDGVLMGVTNKTAESTNGDTYNDEYQPHTSPAVVSFIIVTLVVIVAAATYIVIVKLRKRRFQRVFHIVSYSEELVF